MILFPVSMKMAVKGTRNAFTTVALATTLVGQWGIAEAAGDKAKGEQLYQTCMTCHGQKGEGDPSQKAPRLAGQHDWYIVAQLKNFRDQKRSNPPMFPFIKDLSDQDFEDLAAYISQLK